MSDNRAEAGFDSRSSRFPAGKGFKKLIWWVKATYLISKGNLSDKLSGLFWRRRSRVRFPHATDVFCLPKEVTMYKQLIWWVKETYLISKGNLSDKFELSPRGLLCGGRRVPPARFKRRHLKMRPHVTANVWEGVGGRRLIWFLDHRRVLKQMRTSLCAMIDNSWS